MNKNKISPIGFLFLFFCSFSFASLLEISTETDTVISELIKQKDDIIGVDLYVAGGYENAAFYSQWGHAFLVFVNKNEPYYYNNITLSFEGNAQGIDVSKISGLLNLYLSGAIGTMDLIINGDYFYYFWQKHIFQEGRPFERIIIPLDQETKNNLINKISDFQKKPELLGNYSFLKQNCVGAAVRLLKESGLPLRKIPVIPLNARDSFDKSRLTYTPSEVIQSSYSKQIEMAQYLKENNLVTFGDFNKELINLLVEKFGANAVYALIAKNDYLFTQYAADIMSTYSDEISKNNMLEDYQTYPEFYQLCTGIECAKQVVEKEKQVYPESDFAQNAFQRHLNNTSIKLEDIYSKHYSLLASQTRKYSQIIRLHPTVNNSSNSKPDQVIIGDFNNGKIHLKIKEDILRSVGSKKDTLTIFETKVPVRQDGDELYLLGRKCINLATKSFTPNCGVLIEDGFYQLVVY